MITLTPRAAKQVLTMHGELNEPAKRLKRLLRAQVTVFKTSVEPHNKSNKHAMTGKTTPRP